jgi:Sulfatase
MLRKNWSLFFAPGVWIQLLPLLVMFGLLWITAWTPFHLSFNTFKFWEYLVYGWLYAGSVYLLGLVICTKWLRAWWLAAPFACFYLLLYAINAGFVYHTGMMPSPYFVWVDKPPVGIHFLLEYFTEWIVVVAAFWILTAALATWLIRKNFKTLAAAHLRWLIILTVLLWVAPILRDAGIFRPTVVATAIVHAPQQQGIWRLDQTYSLRDIAANPLVILGGELSVQRPKPLQPRPVSDLKAVSDALKQWRLPLGHRDYPPLGLKPFTRIIMFGTESLSLDFLAPYNKSLPPDLTPFYASLSNHMFVNYQCVALPTQPGLAVTFNSHPNVGGLLTSDYEESLIKYLDAQGFDTYFLMSAPETFLNDDVVFKRMGFRHVIGSQTWLKDPKLAPFVQSWGLMDQKLYDKALDYMETNRNRKIFIQLQNCDTHGPITRDYYGALHYPPLPASLEKIPDPPVRTILASIFRNDYDVGQTIKKMRARNLLTDNTLVIITADHNFPHDVVVDKVPGYPNTYLSRVPLAFISGQPLPPADLRQPHSQLDFAPTIVHLMGLPVPEGWWGESIFAPAQNAPSVSKVGRHLAIIPLGGGPRQIVSLDHPQNTAEEELITLFNNIYTDAPPAEAAAAGAARNLTP